MLYVLSVLAAVLTFASSIPYAIAVMRKQAQPVKATWIVWATIDTITFVAMWMKGVLNFHMAGIIVCVWLITLPTLRHGKPGWSRLDIGCLLVAFAGIGLWFVSGDPLTALVVSLATMLIAAVPTFISAWQDSSREPRAPWLMGAVASLCSVITIPHWTLADALQPFVFLFINGMVALILCIRKPPEVVAPPPAEAVT